MFALISLLGYAATILIGASSARGPRHVPLWSAAMILAAMLIMAFVSLSNVLEATSVYVGFDVVEDYLEVLVFPLVGYSLFLMLTANQMDELRTAVNAAQAEHNFLINVLDTSRVGIVLVNDVGCVTFANRFANDVMGITECLSAHECGSSLTVVPVGAQAPEACVFHPDVQGRAIEGEHWEIVSAGGRKRVGLTASPLSESSGRGAGSVVVLMPISEMPVPPDDGQGSHA